MLNELYYYDYIGFIGIGITVTIYFLLQNDKIKSQDFIYSISNIIGSLMIIYSLMYNWNLTSFIIECFWILISFYGIWKHRSITESPRQYLNILYLRT